MQTCEFNPFDVFDVSGFLKVGGYQSVRNKFLAAVPNTTRYYMLHPELNYTYTQCGVPPANSFHLFRSADDGNLPWTGITIGLTISSIWYWCSDQVRMPYFTPFIYDKFL